MQYRTIITVTCIELKFNRWSTRCKTDRPRVSNINIDSIVQYSVVEQYRRLPRPVTHRDRSEPFRCAGAGILPTGCLNQSTTLPFARHLCPSPPCKILSHPVSVCVCVEHILIAHIAPRTIPCMYVCMYVWSSHIAEYGSTG